MSYLSFISRQTLTIAVTAMIVMGGMYATTAVGMPTARSDDARVLTVVSQSVDIDYGNKIAISTVIDAGPSASDIEAVRALFRPHGGATIWSYSYPEFSVEDAGTNQLSITFEISTGPGSYYPPGAEFDVEIEVTDNVGEASAVLFPDPIEYLDPANNWERVQGDGYTVIYYGVPRSEVEDLVATVDQRIPTLEATLGVTDPPEFKAIVFPSIQAATPSFPPVSQTATDQFLFAGFAQPEYRLFVQGQMNSTTFTHELAHLYAHEAVSSSLMGGTPAWLNEGLARFLEAGSSERSNERLKESVRPDELLSLNRMQSIPGQRSDVFIFYPQAGAFVGYLIEEFSQATMADFLSELNKGRPLLSAFELIYDKSLSEAENDWRALFNADALPIPSPTAEAVDLSPDGIPDTPVPLVDYEALASGSTQPASTAVPVSLPTVTPQKPPVLESTSVTEDTTTNWFVAGATIGLSVIIGVWLFTSRRRIPKPTP